MIVATAGHVDHGKTSLVRQLTGVDTDRLEEEKRRGLTINLGYAYLPIQLPDGSDSTIGFIDVPGHSRFLNTMISGVSGIDLGLLVVAANDGPMPQTIEHIRVMDLLGVKQYAVAITHIDTVDDAAIKDVVSSTKSLLAGESSGNDTPVFPVNNLTGEGIPELTDFLTRQAGDQAKEDSSGLFRMPIDRSFLLKGAGLVVTGTAQSGTIATDDNLLLLPQRKTLRVRSVHANDQSTQSAQGGQRCALNIVGDVDKEQLSRGDWLVTREAGPTTQRLDARVRLLDTAPFGLKHLSPMTLYIGATRVKVKVSFLEDNEGKRRLGPGQTQLVQLLLVREISCCHGDRFLLRDDSESYLLGGGVVVDPWGPRVGKARPERQALLKILEERDLLITLARLTGERREVVNLTRLAQARNISLPQAQALLESDGIAKQIFTWQDANTQYCVSVDHHREVESRLLQQLTDWHRSNPREKGMAVKLAAELLADRKSAPLLVPTTSSLIAKGKIKLGGGLLSLPAHSITLDSGDTKLWSRIEKSLIQHEKNLPPLGDLAKELKLDSKMLLSGLRRACAAQRLYQISERRFALPEVMSVFAEAINTLAEATGKFSVVEYRDHLAIGRNQAIELLEYFDKMKITRRQGNERIVVDADFATRYRSGEGEN